MQEPREIVPKAALKQPAKSPEFNFLSKQDWLELQRRLRKGTHEDLTQRAPIQIQGIFLVFQ